MLFSEVFLRIETSKSRKAPLLFQESKVWRRILKKVDAECLWICLRQSKSSTGIPKRLVCRSPLADLGVMMRVSVNMDLHFRPNVKSN